MRVPLRATRDFQLDNQSLNAGTVITGDVARLWGHVQTGDLKPHLVLPEDLPALSAKGTPPLDALQAILESFAPAAAEFGIAPPAAKAQVIDLQSCAAQTPKWVPPKGRTRKAPSDPYIAEYGQSGRAPRHARATDPLKHLQKALAGFFIADAKHRFAQALLRGVWVARGRAYESLRPRRDRIELYWLNQNVVLDLAREELRDRPRKGEDLGHPRFADVKIAAAKTAKVQALDKAGGRPRGSTNKDRFFATYEELFAAGKIDRKQQSKKEIQNMVVRAMGETPGATGFGRTTLSNWLNAAIARQESTKPNVKT